MTQLTMQVESTCQTKHFISEEARRLFAAIFDITIVDTSAACVSNDHDNSDDTSTDIFLQVHAKEHKDVFCENTQSNGDQFLANDFIAIDLENGRLHIQANRDGALLIALYRFAKEFGARFPRPGQDHLPKLTLEDFQQKQLHISETASYAHRGSCIEGADSLTITLDFIDWLPKIGMNSFFIQFENPYTFFKRWYEHEFNPYLPKEPFSPEIALEMSNNVDSAMRKRGIIHHRVGHGWTGEVLGYSSKFGWEQGITLPEEKKPLAALVNGKRELIDGAPILTSLDFANPEVSAKMVELVVEYARDHNDVDYLHVWLSDACNNICECADCSTTTIADQYVQFLNLLDAALTTAGCDTKICFLLYHELLFAPINERLTNPSRFIMMFAPISRSFESSYADVQYLHDVPDQPPYVRNQFTKPHDLFENLSSLKAWQNAFDGDSFVYDYPLGRAHYGDIGYMAISNIIYRDIAALHTLKLRGYIACQELRAGFPTFFPNYVMGSTLWNDGLDYEELKQDYFASLYGERWQEAANWLESMSALSSCDYFNAIGERIDEHKAEQFKQLIDVADGGLTMIEQSIASSRGLQHDEWVNLSYYRQYALLIAQALFHLARGDTESAQHYWHGFIDFIRRSELNLERNLDVYRVIEVAKNYAGFKLDY